MADTISVTPDVFDKVDFDAARIAELGAKARERVPEIANDLAFTAEVDEDAATSRLAIASLEPLVFAIDGGALEDYKLPRCLGDLETEIAFTRLLLEVSDRHNAGFGAPDLDAEVDQAHKQAWDVNLYGRMARLGLRLHQPRFRYNFRNRHGFTDAADRVFEQLWATDGLTWSKIVELSDQATGVLES